MKTFNTQGICVPERHYMVDLSDRVELIRHMVDKGNYFTINRARQFGKTTTLAALERNLEDGYITLSLDFQDLGDESYRTEGTFVQGMSRIICDAKDFMNVQIPDVYTAEFNSLSKTNKEALKLDDLIRVFLRWCKISEKPVVLIIDEVDSATNNQVFLDFLAQLRSLYLKREKYSAIKIIHSVILAGVTDIKHLKGKIRGEEEHKVNSPWNIAADFDIDMSLSVEGIQDMLDEYANEHQIEMDTSMVATEIRAYTSGYPFLVSKICQILDTSGDLREILSDESKRWTKYGVDEAVRLLLKESDVSLFDSLMGKLTNYPNLKEQLYRILMRGEVIEYLPYDEGQKQLRMYGFIKERHNTVAVSNRIFETLLYNHLLGEDKTGNEIRQTANLERNMFVRDGYLDVPLIMERFIKTFTQVFGELTGKFKEIDGRKYFLLYLKPIINGTGNYYIEAQTRDQKRTDVIIDYLGQQYIIELKIWHGERYNSTGEQQLTEYLEYWQLDTGYMLSFNFNKKKEQGIKRIQIGNKILIEGTV